MTIHQKNIQALAIMMYKVVNNIAPTTVSELFSFSNLNYSLRSGSQFHQPSVNTVWNGQETIWYLGPKFGIWCQRKWNKNHLYFLSKEKLNNGSPTTVRVGYVKTIYQMWGLFNTPCCCYCCCCCCFFWFWDLSVLSWH